ncbi:MAG: hypothetical protein EON59_05770 [Alphaproteobacteria bacterium]|nr:MAG: hypothetical protein EON59_05770 [Alphaproteobacteria bacterium]
MSQAALTKLWSFFALSSLTLSFLFFLRTTGAEPKSDDFGLMGYKAATIPVLALPMDMVLFGIVLWLTWVWSESVTAGNWAERIPIFHFERRDVNPTTRGGKIYQRWAFMFALVAPVLLTLQMAARFFSGSVHQEGQAAVIATGWSQFDFGRLNAVTGMLRFGDPQGPQFFAWEPWVFTAWLGALLTGWLWTLRSIFR